MSDNENIRRLGGGFGSENQLGGIQFSDLLTKVGFGIDVLTAHHVPFSELGKFTTDQQRFAETQSATISNHGDISLYFDELSELYFVKKKYGLKRKYPNEVLIGLAEDYKNHVGDLKRVGIKYPVENYGLTINKSDEGEYIEVYQLFLPYGTALDWAKQCQEIAEITETLIKNHLLPLLTYVDKNSRSYTDAGAYMDPTLKNFAPLPIDNKLILYYFDFFIPRIRDNNGILKTYPGFQLDLVGDKEIEYRFFTKPGIIHNYFKRNFYYFFSDGINTKERYQALSTFVQISQWLLMPFMEEFFPGQTTESLVKTDFSELIPMYVK